MLTQKKQLVIRDYDNDEVRFDPRMDLRLYIEAKSPESTESTCCSIDRPAALAIIATLKDWIGEYDTGGITPCTITLED